MGLRSFIKQYWHKSVWHKTQLICFAVLFTIILFELLFFAGVWYTSLQSGLTVFVEPVQKTITTLSEQKYNVTFSVGVVKAPFCQETCTYTLIDQRTKENSTGTILDPKPQKQDITTTLTSPQRGEYSTSQQLIVACQNQPTPRCQRSRDVATQTSVVRVEHKRSIEQQTAYNALQDQLQNLTTMYEELLSQTLGILDVDDVRATQFSQQAGVEARQIQEHLEGLRIAIENEEFVLAQKIVPPNTTLLEDYHFFVRAEQEAVRTYNSLIQNQDVLRAQLPFLSEQDYREHYLQLTQAASVRNRFYTTSPEYAKTVFALVNQQRPTNTTIALQATQAVQQEKRRVCRVKVGTCPRSPVQPPANIQQAHDMFVTACSALNTLDEQYGQAQQTLIQELNLTAQQANDIIQQKRAEPTFMQEKEAALQSNQTLTDDALRLAIQLEPTPETQRVSQHCLLLNRTLPNLETPLVATLVERPRHHVRIDISLPRPQCCALGECVACNQVSQRTPVLFVHGHSFAEKTSPEYSLQAFSRFALFLQEEGWMHAGAVFPRQTVAAGAFNNTPGGASFTTTYYFDGFAEEGEIEFVTRKTERIETYALRLRETIDNVKTLTGQDEVFIVSHSMGGLVTRSYIEIFGEEDIAGIVMIGTPNNGISRLVERLCPIIGADFECDDMRRGSLYLRRLAQAPAPNTPVLTIAGVGCDGAFDGVVEAESVHLDYARNEIINGTCPSNDVLLHNRMLVPEEYPDVYELVTLFLREHTR